MGTRHWLTPGRIPGREVPPWASRAQNSHGDLNHNFTTSAAGFSGAAWLGHFLNISFNNTSLEKIYGPAFSGEIRAIAGGKDAETFFSELMQLAARLEKSGQTQFATQIYTTLCSEDSCGFESIRRQAKDALDALRGHASPSASFEFICHRFQQSATDHRLLLPMIGGTLVGQTLRSILLARSPLKGMIAWRWIAGASAFAAEVPIFALGQKWLNQDATPISQLLAQATISLGALRIAGPIARPVFRQTAMFGGIMAAHLLETELGYRPRSNGGTVIADAIAGYVLLQSGIHLGKRIFGPTLARFQTEAELRAHTAANQRPSHLDWFGKKPAYANAVGNLGASSHQPSLERPLDIGGMSRPMMMEEFKWRDFQKQYIRIHTNPEAITPKVRASLPKLATEVGRESYQYRLQPEWHTWYALHEYGKLTELAARLLEELPPLTLENVENYGPERWENAVLALLALERFPEALRIADNSIWEYLIGGETDAIENLNRRIIASIPVAHSHSFHFTLSKGFDKFYFFHFIQTLRNLISLSQDYDIFVGIARGGLFSTSIIDLLELPYRLMEVHSHGKKKPSFRWVDITSGYEFEGKRVLLMDKDAVSGGTIAHATRMLEPWKPSAIGVYFNHGPSRANRSSSRKSNPYLEENSMRLSLAQPERSYKSLPPQAIRRLESLGVRIHYPGNISTAALEAAFEKVHARLLTPMGSWRQAQNALQTSPMAVTSKPAWVEFETLRAHWQAALHWHDALNPLVPGARKVRESLLVSMNAALREFQGLQLAHHLPGDTPLQYRHLIKMLETMRIHETMAEEYAMARYHPWGIRLARERGIQLEHIPYAYPAAFRTAQQAIQNGKHDIALIVGPEAFAYEPIFRDLGMPTVAVNIPESEYAGRRTLKILESLDVLNGKSILVVEDDIRSGATLKRLLYGIQPHGAFSRLDLFLGLPRIRQRGENIPKAFGDVFITDPRSEEDSIVFLRHLHDREKLFKQEPPPGFLTKANSSPRFL